jgi:hypothetical protein
MSDLKKALAILGLWFAPVVIILAGLLLASCSPGQIGDLLEHRQERDR